MWDEQPLSAFLGSLFDPSRYLTWAGDLSLLAPVLDFAPTSHLLSLPATSNSPSPAPSTPPEGELEKEREGRWLDWSFLQVVEDDLLPAYEKVRTHVLCCVLHSSV